MYSASSLTNPGRHGGDAGAVAVLQIFALALLAIFPLSVPVALGYVLLLG